MLKKFMILVISGLLLATFVSSAFAKCNVDKQIKDQKASCCQCCCCDCAK